MIEVFLFILKYKIKKDKKELALHTKEFFSLAPNAQKKVLDKYFKHLDKDFNINYYFDNEESRYYENNEEISFFDSSYFCKKIIDLNINNISLIDKFDVNDSQIDYLINYTLKNVKDNKIKLNLNNILIYNGILPKRLSENIPFMTYLTKDNPYNIKYITYNEKKANEQRELIKEVINKVKNQEFDLSKFLLNKELPKLLSINIDFIIYMIENDINNINYLNEKILNSQTITDKHRITNAIINYLTKHNINIDTIEKNISLSVYLNKDIDFINYIISKDVNNVIYVDWHNLTMKDTKNIIDNLSIKLAQEDIEFDYKKYPFKNILLENYTFLTYLIAKDRTSIKEIRIIDKVEVNKLVDIYLNKYKRTEFNLENYIDESGYINNNLVENKNMLSYLIKHDNNIFKYINFFNLSNSKEVTDTIIKEIEKKNFEFDNNSFLRNNKYPIPLSNSYRFMRYVIDKNFNNLSFIDISMIDEKELKRIINYAFRMVYYIRGNNKKLNFDIEGYFKNSPLLDNEYFQECLKCL